MTFGNFVGVWKGNVLICVLPLQIASWYQVSSHDDMIQPETEAWFAERMDAKKIITLDAGHASLASHGKEVAEFILEAAAELS